MSSTICVTGGAGFIGSHVAEALVASGHRVIILDDLSSGRRENVPAGAELAVLDVRSREAADLVVARGVEILVHHAAQMDVRRSVEDPRFDADVNILGLLNLLEAARRGRVRQVVLASTGGAIYGEQDAFPAGEDHPVRPLSPYGVAKLASERYLYFYHQQYGLDATCLRYANVYGPRQNPHGEAGVVAIFLHRLLAGQQPVINGDGLQTRDYVFVGDVVNANLAAIGRPAFGIFNVGTGIETDVNTLFAHLHRAIGSGPAAVHGPGKPGEQLRSSISSALLERELGVVIATPLADGLARTAVWFRDHAARG
ncbi:MAG TPA: NAD-dependent epimerase/dehydratase family protein [Thermoanaerobaculales bacterium]|nr:NAD-dependent epimerase/dehydratase family protein [Thermoanaerobaculales bacterium]HPA81731.1 NAD-dependent epimerase/dehydratase family protein [Thermoanaerobaculales bacterium]HQL29992.1 NAD-dependent epimerase/dehydratase family protein [Thermoanaerobaculales bacterium]HQN96831.1 NAD-dependent epimerase/dehydratase family protein [Thermoanaerobaculales bacterium]